MKNNNSFILIAGVIILGILSYVSYENIFSDNMSSDNFYSKTEVKDMIINEINYIDNKLKINTNTSMVCAKTTKSKPTENSVCWKKTENGIADISIYSYKTYYIWLKDENNNISSMYKYNVKEGSN